MNNYILRYYKQNGLYAMYVVSITFDGHQIENKSVQNLHLLELESKTLKKTHTKKTTNVE